jgi:membrane-bound lytic murein transglycosylase A
VAIAPAPPKAPLAPVEWTELPGWRDDRVNETWPAFVAGCRALVASARTRDSWQAVCSAAASMAAPDAATARRFLEDHFIAYRVAGPDGADEGLVTGYYEPLLEGSRERDARHGVALHAPPPDLVTVELASLFPDLAGKRVRGRVEGRKVVPYWTRAEIEAGRLPRDTRVLAWLADPIDAFFLQIQGSGRVRLADGAVLRLGYADQNGHPYTPVGRVLVERGELAPDAVSMQAIRAWGERNRDRLPALLDANASYVFFRETPAPALGTPEASIDGPYGSLGVPLLAQRTIAVDPSHIPLGAPVYLASNEPGSSAPLQRLTLAQDTGGAIRGAVRADFFWGTGAQAADKAGRMRERGRLWLLWPRGVPLPPR